MTTLGNGRQRTADWQVTAVFDPDGEGQDFAYTVGLFERDLPELHLWARPSLGDDPGADWKFSPHDCCRILNELAWQLIDGELAIGDSWEQPVRRRPGHLPLPPRPTGRPRRARGVRHHARRRGAAGAVVAAPSAGRTTAATDQAGSAAGDIGVRRDPRRSRRRGRRTVRLDAARGVRAGRGVRPAHADGCGAGGRVLVGGRDHPEQPDWAATTMELGGVHDVAGDRRRARSPARSDGSTKSSATQDAASAGRRVAHRAARLGDEAARGHGGVSDSNPARRLLSRLRRALTRTPQRARCGPSSRPRWSPTDSRARSGCRVGVPG